jgi:NAD(P)-dependent dehydrogenase (short-subunit alcohol dehydrogenase family)
MCGSARSPKIVEIAVVVTFLASDAAAYINGQTIAVDGGTTTSNAMLASALAPVHGA